MGVPAQVRAPRADHGLPVKFLLLDAPNNADRLLQFGSAVLPVECRCVEECIPQGKGFRCDPGAGHEGQSDRRPAILERGRANHALHQVGRPNAGHAQQEWQQDEDVAQEEVVDNWCGNRVHDEGYYEKRFEPLLAQIDRH